MCVGVCIIVNRGEWLWNRRSSGLDRAQNTIVVYWGSNQWKRVGYATYVLCISAKQKILHGHGPSEVNVGIFARSFDVFRASLLFCFVNYGVYRCVCMYV